MKAACSDLRDPLGVLLFRCFFVEQRNLPLGGIIVEENFVTSDYLEDF